MDQIVKEINKMEDDQDKLQRINEMQRAIDEVKQSYSKDYSEHSQKLLGTFKERLRDNTSVSNAVEQYVSK